MGTNQHYVSLLDLSEQQQFADREERLANGRAAVDHVTSVYHLAAQDRAELDALYELARGGLQNLRGYALDLAGASRAREGLSSEVEEELRELRDAVKQIPRLAARVEELGLDVAFQRGRADAFRSLTRK